ncbi:4Fe-4S cluster-binding domain-containing protein [Nocardia caishijiensis]|uniref:Anaerobic ribonucleoside-triphosphate reductase activating protein n=1 Tax=Nocardia caishijiensis TaxID=184756 RepID=A0ABQ6YIK5_9NOCA|nr:4Fe-4S cluster-binding domain-containing protein [Nocardia caishijiensis]KAF0845281.1 anaerobic ribonucleoside-triphosphate reductase activating protein [Nocardia caishijiensis]
MNDTEGTLLLSRLHHPVRNLGFGVRAGIWFQGCTVYCRGCIARDTWPFDPDRTYAIAGVLDWLTALPAEQVDGVTISGGEPTDQPAALAALLAGIHAWRGERDIDVLLYSGRDTAFLAEEFGWLAATVDVLVSEPYLLDRADGCALRGSRNQIVQTFSELGARRYPLASLEDDYGPQRNHVSVAVDNGSIWTVGIPLPGDMAAFRTRMTELGIETKRTSWLM